MPKKLKIALIIVSLLVINTLLLIVLGRGSKYCETDLDCYSKSGCYNGCWSKIPSLPTFTCTTTKGPDFCLCHQNKCTAANEIPEEVDKERLIEVCKNEDECDKKIEHFFKTYKNY